MLEFDKKSNLLMTNRYQYSLQDVAEPNLYRELYDYESIPKVAFNMRHVPENMPDEIWMTDTTFRDGQQSVSPFTVEQIVHLYSLMHRLGGPKGLIRQSEFFLYTDKDKKALHACQDLGYDFPEITTWIRANEKDFELVKQAGVKETGILVSCSDYHIFKKMRLTRKQAMDKYLGIVKAALDRGIRPREVTVRFNWNINSQPNPRIADVTFTSKKEVELARHDNLVVTQQAAEPIEENTRGGDSIALLAIARTLETIASWENGERMDNWDNVILWEEGMEGYTPEKKGRVKYARFFMFNTKEELPFEVQYLTAADELSFYSNVNAFLKDLTTGEYITKLTQLRRLTISAYGLVSLDKNFTALKNLEYLDLSSNNFQKVPEEINPTNFPKLRTLNMGANTRKNIYDLSNTIETNYGGLVEEQGFPRRLIEWDLDTLVLSVNYLQGPLPKMDDWEKYTEQDIIDADTLPRALIGTPKVMPHTKRFAINLNRLTGELPDWLLYHPALDWWVPSVLVFTQEGKDATGTLAGFTNEPANMNYYYEFYEGYKKDPGTEEEEEETTK